MTSAHEISIKPFLLENNSNFIVLCTKIIFSKIGISILFKTDENKYKICLPYCKQHSQNFF